MQEVNTRSLSQKRELEKNSLPGPLALKGTVKISFQLSLMRFGAAPVPVLLADVPWRRALPAEKNLSCIPFSQQNLYTCYLDLPRGGTHSRDSFRRVGKPLHQRTSCKVLVSQDAGQL